MLVEVITSMEWQEAFSFYFILFEEREKKKGGGGKILSIYLWNKEGSFYDTFQESKGVLVGVKSIIIPYLVGWNFKWPGTMYTLWSLKTKRSISFQMERILI